MANYILLLFTPILLVAQNDFLLEDLNPSSNYFGENVGPSTFNNEVTLVYFGHYNWGTCTARFGELNDLYEEIVSDGYDQVKLIGVGKSQHMSSLSNWIVGNDASVCGDNSPYPTWDEWDASQRDLYILDHEGVEVFHQNITNGLDDNYVYNLVSVLVDNISTTILGDINGDSLLNVLDVVLLVNGILQGTTIDLSVSDINQDGTLNVLDVVLLVNIILTP